METGGRRGRKAHRTAAATPTRKNSPLFPFFSSCLRSSEVAHDLTTLQGKPPFRWNRRKVSREIPGTLGQSPFPFPLSLTPCKEKKGGMTVKHTGHALLAERFSFLLAQPVIEAVAPAPHRQPPLPSLPLPFLFFFLLSYAHGHYNYRTKGGYIVSSHERHDPNTKRSFLPPPFFLPSLSSGAARVDRGERARSCPQELFFFSPFFFFSPLSGAEPPG